MTKHRKGSMAEADAKSARRFFGLFSLILLILVGITIFPTGTYFHEYYSRSSSFLKVIGFVLIPVWFWFVWIKSENLEWEAWIKGVVMFFGIAAILLFLFGFNLTL